MRARSAERSAEVVPELLHALQPDAETDQARRDALGLPAAARLEHRPGPAEARGVDDPADGRLDASGRVRAAAHVEGEHRAEAGVAHRLDRVVAAEPPRELPRRLRLAPDPHLERLEAAQQQPGLVRARNDSAPPAELEQALV